MRHLLSFFEPGLALAQAIQGLAEPGGHEIERLRQEADPLTPDRFLELTADDLLRIGFSRQKARYGRALATDTLADSFAPPALVRWLTGNAGGR
jgi:3-methyladenine DNA glycosylase/8-oxoguanine DNA glycosylase